MKLTTEHKIDAAPEAVWDLMGERFADIGQWSNTVVHSSLEGELGQGALRTCELKPTPSGLSVIQERITEFDRNEKTFAFDIVTGLPGFMRRVNSRWTIKSAAGGGTRAINTLTIDVAWWMRPMLPVIRGQFAKTIRGFIPEIERAAGQPLRVEPAAVAG